MSFTANSTGGEYRHKLTIQELAKHSHQYYSPVVQLAWPYDQGNTYGNYNKQYLISSGDTGNDTPHNNIQPYLTVYFWRRTA